jgi:hypothetical protein
MQASIDQSQPRARASGIRRGRILSKHAPRRLEKRWTFLTKSLEYGRGARHTRSRSLPGMGFNRDRRAVGLAGPITRRKNCRAHTVGRDRLTMPGVPRLYNTLRGKVVCGPLRGGLV